MIKLETKINKIKNSNLVYLLENNTDLEKLKFLKLDKKILKKINSSIEENKSLKLEFFL
jgi:hypothetical protein